MYNNSDTFRLSNTVYTTNKKYTPGEFECAQFDLKDLLEIRLEEEVQ